jgi:ATP phosphoribosyltransferase
MSNQNNNKKIKIALSKGRLFESTLELFEKSGIILDVKHRNYKPTSNLKNVEFFVIKPRNVPKMVEQNMFDVGIVGIDLVHDEQANVSKILDLKTMPVFIVVAGKKEANQTNHSQLTIASEYTNIAKEYFKKQNQPIDVIKTYGSTECFVPDFANLIVDHTQSGETLKKNKLMVFEIVLRSTTHLIANMGLTNEQKKTLNDLKEKLKLGLEKMDFTYPNFLSQEEIMQIGRE